METKRNLTKCVGNLILLVEEILHHLERKQNLKIME